jgi:hypothetical protein
MNGAGPDGILGQVHRALQTASRGTTPVTSDPTTLQ